MEDIIKALEAPVNPNIPHLQTGDSVSVHASSRSSRKRLCVDLLTQQGAARWLRPFSIF